MGNKTQKFSLTESAEMAVAAVHMIRETAERTGVVLQDVATLIDPAPRNNMK